MGFTVTPDVINLRGRDFAVDLAIHDVSHQLLKATGRPGPYDVDVEDVDEGGMIHGKVTVPAS